MNYQDPTEPALHWLDIIEDDELLILMNFYSEAQDWDGMPIDLPDEEEALGQKIFAEIKRRGLEW